MIRIEGDYVIEVKSLKKKYKKTVLKDINLSVGKGECIGILGANGCGKTTLLSIMAGVRRPNGGQIFYDGNDALKNRRIFSEKVGYVPQENPLIDELSAKDNLRLWYSAKDYRLAVQNGIIKSLGIDQYLSSNVGRLSGGMKRRLSIAAALANNADILIMDEPGAALDIYGKEEIRNYIKSFLSKGGTVIMSTHDESEIKICSTIYFMEDGVLKKY